jgi:hypothetical protein
MKILKKRFLRTQRAATKIGATARGTADHQNKFDETSVFFNIPFLATFH